VLKHKLEWLANGAYTMKRGSLLYQCMLVIAGVAALGAKAQGTPIQSTAFAVDVVITTDTFETAGGAVLFTTSGVGYNENLSPSMAADIAADTTLPLQVQSTASLIPQVSDYVFLTETPSEIGPDYFVLDGVGPAIAGTGNQQGNLFVDVADALIAAGGSWYSLTMPLADVPLLAGPSDIYAVTGSGGDPDVTWVGDIAINVYDQNIVEQAPAAVPEPSTLAFLSAGLLTLIIVGRRKAVG
jgi:PEP-CTERM motif-containing protein